MSGNRNAGSGIAVIAGLLAVATFAMPSDGQAASEARRIALHTGPGIQIVTRPAGAFAAAPQSSAHAAGDAILEYRVRALTALVDQLERERGGRPPSAPILVRLEPVPVFLVDYCERGLFGRVTNAPCRVRPDATILNRR